MSSVSLVVLPVALRLLVLWAAAALPSRATLVWPYMFVLIVAGQLFTALLMDHFGVLGMRENPISLQKMIGIVLVIGGAYLVNKK